MNVDLKKLAACLAWGAFWGAAAWSAYAVVEFVFSSLVFYFTRPYAVFSAWHWHLTALLALTYLIAGPLAGALAGLVTHFLRGRLPDDANPMRLLESAATLPLALVFLGNGIGLTVTGLGFGGIWQAIAAAVCTLFLVMGLCSPSWMDRLGLITNPWIISGLLLGLGQELDVLNMSVAAQLGSSIGQWAMALTALLVLTAALSILIGRRLANFLAAHRRGYPGLGLTTVSAGLVLMWASAALSTRSSVAEAAPLNLSTSARPNIVLIVMDTVRADHLSLYGYNRDTTPNLKALAQDGVAYTNAISSSDITLTSHASIFTGMYASWHSAYCQPPEAAYGRELSKQYPTVAEVLKSSGYETIGVAANLYLRANFGLERGFDEFRIPRPVPMLPDQSRSLLRHHFRKWMSYAADTAQFDRLFTLGQDVDDELFRTLAHRAHPDAPFFVFLNYMDAHFPYVPPAPYSARFPGRHPRTTQDDLENDQYNISDGAPIPPAYPEHCLSQYDGGIAYEDAQIGRVVSWLKSHNAYDNTMIVVTSDHGEAFGERKRVGHANSPYQNLLHVVLLVKYPKSTLRGPESALASLTDVAPTIYGAASVPAPKTLQGRDLASQSVPREIYSETFPCPVIRPRECKSGCTTTSIFSWPFKFIYSDQQGGRLELFDLSADPDERRNLIIRQQDQATDLRARLDAWSRPAQTRQVKQANPEQQKGLEGLGYIGK